MAQATQHADEYWRKRAKRVLAKLATFNPEMIARITDDKGGLSSQRPALSDYLTREFGLPVELHPVPGKKCTIYLTLTLNSATLTKLGFELRVGASVATYLKLNGYPELRVVPLNREQIAFVHFLAEEQGIQPDEAFELLFYRGATSYYSSRRSLRRRLFTKWRRLHNMGVYPDYVLGYFTKANKRIAKIGVEDEKTSASKD